MNKSIKTISIKSKIFLSLTIVLVLGFLITGILIIKAVKTNTSKEIAKQLTTQTNMIKSFIESTDKTSKVLSEKSKKDVTEQLQKRIDTLWDEATTIYNLSTRIGDGGEVYRLEQLLLDTKFGTNGFAYAIDMNGKFVIHPTAKGKVVANKPHIKEMLNKKSGIIKYQRIFIKDKPWMYAAYKEFPQMGWILAVVVPVEELYATSKFIKESLINDVKSNIKNVKIGKTGYYYVMNSKGTLIVHPKSEGKNVSKYPFVREMMQKKNGVIHYPWEGKPKVVAYTYYPERDWIIAGGSYENEFIGAEVKSLIIQFIIISVIVIIVALVILTIIFKVNILKPIEKLEVLFGKISLGDLTTVIDNYKTDEIGRIIENVDNMVIQMNKALCNVNSSTLRVHESAESLSTSSEEMAKGAESQAEQVTQVEVAVHEMTSTIQEISQNVEDITSEVNQIKEAASTGGEVLEETVSSIHNLSDAVNQTAGSIKELDVASRQIGEILQVISEITDQTNLLALNAAIEAARAGEHGRGFAVVADEVRKLAERTANATTEIDSMIGNIQKEVQNSVSQMDKGVELAEEGGMMVGNLRMSLEEIINGVMDIADKINAVAAAVEEQSATSQEISTNMADIVAVSQESASIAEENSGQAKTLIALAEELTNIVRQFKLNDCNQYKNQ